MPGAARGLQGSAGANTRKKEGGGSKEEGEKGRTQ